LKAVRYIRRCGYDFPNLNVSVLPAAATLPDAAGNALVEEPRKDGEAGESRLELVWKGQRQLRIAHNPEMRLRFSSTSAAGVTIEHATTFEVGT
jgi:predicted dienelactone hydrolase